MSALFLAWHAQSGKKIVFLYNDTSAKETFWEGCKGNLLDKVPTPLVRQDSKVVHRKEKSVNVIHREDFKTINEELEDVYTLPRWFKIIEEGPSDEFFGDSSSTNDVNPNNSSNAYKHEGVEAPAII